MLVFGKSLENRSPSVGWGANTVFCSWFTWSKIQLICRNEFLLKYVLQSTNTSFENVHPVDGEVGHREEIRQVSAWHYFVFTVDHFFKKIYIRH